MSDVQVVIRVSTWRLTWTLRAMQFALYVLPLAWVAPFVSWFIDSMRTSERIFKAFVRILRVEGRDMRGLFRIVEAENARVVWINLAQVVSVHEGEGSVARYAVINVGGNGPRQRYHVVEPAEQVVEAMRRASLAWVRPLA